MAIGDGICHVCKHNHAESIMLECPETGEPICPRCYDETRMKLLKEGLLLCMEICHAVIRSHDTSNRAELMEKLDDVYNRLGKYDERWCK